MINRRTFAKQLLSIIGLSTVPIVLGADLTTLIEPSNKIVYPIVFTEFEPYMVAILGYVIDQDIITQICRSANHDAPIFPHEDELFIYDGALKRVIESKTGSQSPHRALLSTVLR